MNFDLKIRFTLALIVINSALMALFTFSLYERIQEQLLISAEKALGAHMNQEWQHLQFHGGDVSSFGLAPGSSEIYHQIFKNGVLIHDLVPKSLKEPSGNTLLPIWKDKISRDFHGHLQGVRFEMIGYYDLRSIAQSLSELRSLLLKRCLLGLLLLGPCSWYLAKLLLRPFYKLSRNTLDLDAQKLSFRFSDPKRKDEYGVLVKSFNVLLGRLESSFHQLRRFSGNVSHELRTPLTVIRGEAELLLRRRRDVSEYEEGLKKIVGRADGIQKIINRLLFLSDLERTQLDCHGTEVQVDEKINEIVKALQKMHRTNEKEIEISASGIFFKGPSDLFSSIATNILENALKYSKAKISVSFQNGENGLSLRVEDDGPGIPPDKRQHVFEPFSKLGLHDSPKEAAAESHGLGLSIVKACVDAVRGNIELGESRWGGLLVKVWFPQISKAGTLSEPRVSAC